jgi:hypothetical protein
MLRRTVMHLDGQQRRVESGRQLQPARGDGRLDQRRLRPAIRRHRPHRTVNMAYNLGIPRSDHLPKVYSIILGTGLVSPLDMASAYSTFAANGITTIRLRSPT